MIFNSVVFLSVFLPAVLLLYRLVPGRRGKDGFLCAASLVFYAFGGLGAIPVLLGSAVCSYAGGLILAGAAQRRKLACALAVAVLLGILCAYKYLDFLTGVVGSLLGIALPSPGLALPMGISFFTFHGISYVVDVYRDPARVCRRFGRLLLYISFFPRLVAGPIVRWQDAAGQLEEHPTSPELTASGLARFARGMAKKLLIADVAGGLATAVFALEGDALAAPLAWSGALGYCVQIFFDFSGYSDMAIGLGRLFGFRFPENFNYPYISRSLTEFWRRWHMTLNRWFVDYLYIPLGGSRRGKGRTLVNKFIVFFFTGLWHGAGWTFILWGLWHGLFVCLEEAARPALDRLERRRAGRALLRVYTLLVVVLGFVMFRAVSVEQGFFVLSRMFSHFSLAGTSRLAFETILTPARWAALGAGILLSTPVFPALGRRLGIRDGSPAASLGTGLLALVLLALCFLNISGGGFTPFIYQQF